MDFPLFNSVYRPPETPTINGWKFESYDEDFWAIENGTMLDGYFQSDKYFARDWKYARRVLGPSPRAVGTALSKLSQLGCDPRNTIAIHVRRGDYLHQTEPFTLSRYGWTLPTSYYTDSIERFSGNQKLLFLTDDPGYVRETFGPDSIVASSSVPSIDLLMLSLCRFNVLSNSTFAWWGAYLGGDEGRTVLAPRYWMGWESQRWMPSDIQVEWWNYVDVQRT
ncbi:MAG: alpha-1,2-fucosyltransferase [Rubrivivax sp.]|nr:alpha-1,2-fucosyltransferase [Rubrivivax sp.]